MARDMGKNCGIAKIGFFPLLSSPGRSVPRARKRERLTLRVPVIHDGVRRNRAVFMDYRVSSAPRLASLAERDGPVMTLNLVANL
ncbi:MAG TPA: hypothetical protein VHD34_01805 [Xanthobacteraceae bacterium]|nr:hypothetical protein [Xanthobacteraceae bacterium]